MVLRLGESASFYKVGLQLIYAGGIPARDLASAGKKVFLDAKLLDTTTPSATQSSRSSASGRPSHRPRLSRDAAAPPRGDASLKPSGSPCSPPWTTPTRRRGLGVTAADLVVAAPPTAMPPAWTARRLGRGGGGPRDRRPVARAVTRASGPAMPTRSASPRRPRSGPAFTSSSAARSPAPTTRRPRRTPSSPRSNTPSLKGGNRARRATGSSGSMKDPEGYKKYLAANPAAFKKYGAHFLVRGGPFDAVAGTARAERS